MKPSPPPRYFLEQYRGYWRLRRQGNRYGTARGSVSSLLNLARLRGWQVVEPRLAVETHEDGL